MTPLSPESTTERIKGFAKNVGGDLVGIAKLDPNWIYSHRGEIHRKNWEDWGKGIPVDHQYCVVVAEEMDVDVVGSAPHTPSVIESMKNYAKGAYIATQSAAFIANMGKAATNQSSEALHGHSPPLAVDAGLCEVGRLGYLMTKAFGPRVRLSAVTTNMMLVPDKPMDIGATDFCVICKKYGTCCPSDAIPLDDYPQPVNGPFGGNAMRKLALRLLGKDRNRRLYLHESLPLESCPDLAAQTYRLADLQKPTCPADVQRHGRYLLREKAETQGAAGVGTV